MMMTGTGNHIFVIVNGQLYGWGSNNCGQLETEETTQNTPQIVKFFADKNVQQVSCGDQHTLAIANDQLYSFGYNINGWIETDDNINLSTPLLVEFFADKKVQQVICGSYHILAIADDQIYTWGHNYYGQLGIGKSGRQNMPQLVKFFANKKVQQLVCGSCYVFAIANTYDSEHQAQIYAWGNNNYGQLGLGNNTQQNTPQLVDFFTDKNVQQLFYGSDHVFASVNNQLYAWGCNNKGQLGIGNNNSQNTPQLVENLTGKNIRQLVGGYRHTLAIATANNSDGSEYQVYAWGSNDYGQLGLGNNVRQNTPQLVEFFADKKMQHLVSGYDHVLAIADGQVYTWGKNNKGQLGTGNYNNQNTPQLVEFFAENPIPEYQIITRIKSARK